MRAQPGHDPRDKNHARSPQPRQSVGDDVSARARRALPRPPTKLRPDRDDRKSLTRADERRQTPRVTVAELLRALAGIRNDRVRTTRSWHTANSAPGSPSDGTPDLVVRTLS